LEGNRILFNTESKLTDWYLGGSCFESQPTHRLYWFFLALPHSLYINTGVIPRLCYDCFFPSPSQFIIDCSPYHSPCTLWNADNIFNKQKTGIRIIASSIVDSLQSERTGYLERCIFNSNKIIKIINHSREMVITNYFATSLFKNLDPYFEHYNSQLWVKQQG
jgi:hypothetical protein